MANGGHIATPQEQQHMIVFTGDWVKLKYNKQWKQVVSINFNDDTFATLDVDGGTEWWDTEDPAVFLDHLSNTAMQSLLKEI